MACLQHGASQACLIQLASRCVAAAQDNTYRKVLKTDRHRGQVITDGKLTSVVDHSI